MKKIALMLVGVIVALAASAQVYPLKSSYGLTSDTVINTATSYLEVTPALTAAPATTTSFWVAVTKSSGTVGGTITLQASPDGVNYKAINTVGTQTALATVTATDATNTYHWILQGCPFPYYRVSWTGTGTMNATFRAWIYRAK